MIQRMQAAQQRVLKEVWDHRAADLPLKTPDQLVVLASMIEKETGKADERSRVAAVFVNRLKQKMRLQSDPTIIYGLVGGKGTLGRPIMKSEIEQPTPYNTYVIDGSAAGADLQSRPRFTRSGRQSGAHPRDLFCRRWHRRPRFRRVLRSASEERGAAARDRDATGKTRRRSMPPHRAPAAQARRRRPPRRRQLPPLPRRRRTIRPAPRAAKRGTNRNTVPERHAAVGGFDSRKPRSCDSG